MSSHLRTFKYKLWNKIDNKDLRDEQQNYFKVSWDMAFMFPMLEMSNKKSEFIQEILYCYNRNNPLNDDKLNNELQLKTEAYIRSKKKYNKL